MFMCGWRITAGSDQGLKTKVSFPWQLHIRPFAALSVSACFSCSSSFEEEQTLPLRAEFPVKCSLILVAGVTTLPQHNHLADFDLPWTASILTCSHSGPCAFSQALAVAMAIVRAYCAAREELGSVFQYAGQLEATPSQPFERGFGPVLGKLRIPIFVQGACCWATAYFAQVCRTAKEAPCHHYFCCSLLYSLHPKILHDIIKTPCSHLLLAIHFILLG